jgi:hypothetical protein
MIESEAQKQETAYPAEKARGGEIVLRKTWQRAVFIAALAAPFVLLLALMIWSPGACHSAGTGVSRQIFCVQSAAAAA